MSTKLKTKTIAIVFLSLLLLAGACKKENTSTKEKEETPDTLSYDQNTIHGYFGEPSGKTSADINFSFADPSAAVFALNYNYSGSKLTMQKQWKKDGVVMAQLDYFTKMNASDLYYNTRPYEYLSLGEHSMYFNTTSTRVPEYAIYGLRLMVRDTFGHEWHSEQAENSGETFTFVQRDSMYQYPNGKYYTYLKGEFSCKVGYDWNSKRVKGNLWCKVDL